MGEVRLHYQLRAAQSLSKRSALLDATDLVDDASLDPYAFMRDAYLQRRTALIRGNSAPREPIHDDFFEEDYE